MAKLLQIGAPTYLIIYHMCKAADSGIVISEIKLTHKKMENI
jgi:molybdenum cofactor biosynthesis enzyme